jgi:hypothetical protein
MKGVVGMNVGSLCVKPSVRFRKFVGVVGSAVVASTFLASAAGASYGGATIGNGVAPGSVKSGQTLLIAGGGYRGSVTLTIVLGVGGKVLGHAKTTSKGKFSSDVKIPTGTPSGNYFLLFEGVGANGAKLVDRLHITVHTK